MEWIFSVKKQKISEYYIKKTNLPMLGFIKTDQICARQKGAEQIIYPRMTAIVSLIVLILALEIFLFE